MKLLLDVGNSCLKWARMDASGALQEPGRVLWRDQDMEEVLDDNLGSLSPPEQVHVASVAGEEVRVQLEDWVRGSWGCPLAFLETAAEGWGVRNAYPRPAQMGPDRWAALVAARDGAPGPVVVVDCGTAVTVDALDAAGAHQGGLILPGLETMRRSLLTDTAAIQDTPSEGAALLACSTGDAVAAGTLYTLVAAIDRIGADLADALGDAPERVLTGGDAGAVLPLLAGPWRHRPLLVLQGLALTVGRPAGAGG